MKKLVISNKGILETEALSLLGASTKRGNDKLIGQFGSGNKYALAYFLRNNIPIEIYSDGKLIPISVKQTNFRDQVFDVIYINGEKTSLTTEMGGCDWELWQAIREIYCNALDEGEEDPLLITEDVSPFVCSGYTTFCIHVTPEVQDIVDNFHLYFSNNTKVIFEENSIGKALEKKSPEGEVRIFRRGILVSVLQVDKPALYDYDFPDVTINESRVTSYWWEVSQRILELFYFTEEKRCVQQFINTDCYEKTVGSSSIVTKPNYMSDAWQHFANIYLFATPAIWLFLKQKDEKGQLPVIIPEYLLDSMQQHLKDVRVLGGKSFNSQDGFSIYNMTDNMEKTLALAKKHLEESNIQINYPVNVVSFMDTSLLGKADRNQQQIYISDKCFKLGLQNVMETLVEEWVHLYYDVDDETRSMQDTLLQLLCQNILKEA